MLCCAVGHLVEGLPFHEFYFDLLKSRGDAYTPPVNTISQPHVSVTPRCCGVVFVHAALVEVPTRAAAMRLSATAACHTDSAAPHETAAAAAVGNAYPRSLRRPCLYT